VTMSNVSWPEALVIIVVVICVCALLVNVVRKYF
jgi:hypothetical protein